MPQEKKYIEADTVIMASGKNFFDSLFKSLALIGGAWISVELIKAFGKKRTYGVCPNCNYSKVPFKKPKCPVCKSKLNWSKVVGGQDER